MRKHILIIFICLFCLSDAGFCRDLWKEEVSRKIALLTVMDDEIVDFHRLNLVQESLVRIDIRLDEILYSRYSIEEIPEFSVQGVKIYEIASDMMELESMDVIRSPARKYWVAVGDDFKSYMLLFHHK